jgi:hypothetical protein
MEYLLTNVNDWLKHAEGKHAVLIGLNSAIIGLVMNQLNINEWVWSIYTIYPLWMITLMFTSIICSIISYLPILNPKYFKISKKNTMRKRLNPMFFKDAAEMEPKDLIQLIVNEADRNENEFWIAEQIIANSRITTRKYSLFIMAVWLSFFALFPPIALLIGIVQTILKRRYQKND